MGYNSDVRLVAQLEIQRAVNLVVSSELLLVEKSATSLVGRLVVLMVVPRVVPKGVK